MNNNALIKMFFTKYQVSFVLVTEFLFEIRRNGERHRLFVKLCIIFLFKSFALRINLI